MLLTRIATEITPFQNKEPRIITATTIDTPLGEIEYDSDLTYTVGAEAGLSFGLFMVGAEVGYSIADYTAKDRASTNLDEIDFSGIYAKVLVGVGF